MRFNSDAFPFVRSALVATLGLQLCLSAAGAADPSTTAEIFLKTYRERVEAAQKKVREIETSPEYETLKRLKDEAQGALDAAKQKKILEPGGLIEIRTQTQGGEIVSTRRRVNFNLFSWLKDAGTAQAKVEERYWDVKKYEKRELEPAKENLEKAMKDQNDQRRRLLVLETKLTEESVLRKLDSIGSEIQDAEMRKEVLAAVYDQTRLGEYLKQKMAAMVESESFCRASKACQSSTKSSEGNTLINEIFAKETVGNAVKTNIERSSSATP